MPGSAVFPRPCRAALAGAVLLSALGCSSTTQLDTIEAQVAEIQRQVLQLQRLAAGKEELAALEGRLAEQSGKVVKGQADVQTEIERLRTEVEAMRARVESTQGDLGEVIQTLAATNQLLREQRTTEPSSVLPVAGDQTGNPEEVYQNARSDFMRGNYDLAVLGFRQYMEGFPDTALADNALYWIGECYFSQSKYREAIQEFTNLQRRYPNSEKLASAVLKKGYSHLQLKERSEGVVQLRAVIRDFPHSDEAKLARQTLEGLGLDASS